MLTDGDALLAFDVGRSEVGWTNAGSFTSDSPLTYARDAGCLRLERKFVQTVAQKEVTITTKVYNTCTDASFTDIRLAEVADIDAGPSFSDDFAGRAPDSARV